jgi:putative ABC transport system ATP-binding protein
MIKVKELRKIYGTKQNKFAALKGVSLDIQTGDSIAIVGKSGSGKSTLMHLLAGLDQPTSGQVIYEDQDISKLNGIKLAQFRNETMGFVFQQFFLQPNLNCLENVLLPLKIQGMEREKSVELAKKALEEVQMSDKIYNKATDLSGGQKQRVSIARAIVNNPKVLFADEPTGNLDTETGTLITNLLFKLNKDKGITLIIVTHDQDLAEQCNKKIYIKDGNIINTK